jgi:exopolysaccharide biosynthesis operon protein EpsL
MTKLVFAQTLAGESKIKRKQNKKRCTIVLTSLTLLWSPVAWPLDNDRILFHAGANVTSDSNVFRLPSAVDPQLFIGTTEKSDVSRTETAGVSLDLPYARQRFTGGFNISKTRFSRFPDLNYDGRDINAKWLWQLGNDLNGDITSSDTRTLAGFTNSQKRLRNILDNQTDGVNVTYLISPSIRAEAGFMRSRLDNGEAERQVNDFTSDSLRTAIKYTPSSGNSFGIEARTDNASFPNQLNIAGSILGNDYRQHTLEGLFDYRPTGIWRFYGRIGRLNREYRDLSERNFSGEIENVGVDWIATAKSSVSVVARNDLTAFQDLTTNYMRLQSITVRPTWNATTKLTLQLSYSYEKRDYLGDPGFILGITERRVDRLHNEGATLSYQPTRNVLLSVSWQHEKRSSNFLFNEYDARILSGNLQGQF